MPKIHSHGDVRYIPSLRHAAPEMVAAFFGFDKAAFDPHIGTLDLAARKQITVQAGASKEQVAEAIMVAPRAARGRGRQPWLESHVNHRRNRLMR